MKRFISEFTLDLGNFLFKPFCHTESLGMKNVLFWKLNFYTFNKSMF